MKKQSTLIALVLSITLLVATPGVLFGDETNPLLRFPDIHKDKVVFVSAGDIWLVPASGGNAKRLTIHDGEEKFPKFSPDGELIAFTGEYDGNADVYVMNTDGGNITRLTFHPGHDEVLGWHPTKNKILFQTSRSPGTGIPTSRIYTISPEGGMPEPLILIEAARGSFSHDGNQIAFNKTARADRTWKRYQGGRAQDVYVYNLENDKEHKLTDFEGTDRYPMWINDAVYFSSDRDGHLNLYSIKPDKEGLTQLTHHDTYDVRRPSAGENNIVYEYGGDIWIMDINGEEPVKIDITIGADALGARPRRIDVKEFITGIGISPNGNRALVETRGEIFTVPRNHGPIYNLTKSSGARDKDPAWSPNGEKVAYISDQDGEYEIHVIDAKGKKEAIKLTEHEEGYRHTLRWSPDGNKIAFTDQNLTLYYLDVDSKEIAKVDKAHYESVDVPIDEKPIYDFRWSPDSRYLAYSKMTEKQVFQIFIYALENEKVHNVSQNLFNDFHPVFTKDGKHLLFVSNRSFDPTFDDFEWEMVYKDVAGIYALTLEKDEKPLLPFQNDEATQENNEKNSGNQQLNIDFEGISDRVEKLPLPKGNYRYLSVNDQSLFYLNKDEGDFNRFEFRGVETMDLYAFDFESRKERKVIGDIEEYQLSEDGQSIAYLKDEDVGIINSSETESKGHKLDLANLEMQLHPRKEWKQIYNEAWRMERDYYYEPNMHGVDWELMKNKYEKLLDRAASREDVRYIIGELIGELNTSHTYVSGGDKKREAESTDIGMLGADYEIDAQANRYRFKKILRNASWSRSAVPPLDLPGMNVKEGDYLLEVNGEKVTADKNIHSYFQGLAGEQVHLTINNRTESEGAREITVKPLNSERTLRYINWVERNRKKVDELTDGKVGYIHFPDTYMGSATYFPRYFYSQLRKEALVIDGRFNGGGLDPYIFLRRLNTKPMAYWTRRYSHDQTIPPTTTMAHMVCLTNKYAGSGGDMLPFEFREMGMGEIVGTTTWGGLVGVSQFIPLIDGGMITAPDYRIYNTEGEWIIENEGVTPDRVIELDSKEMSNDIDAQLREGIEILMEKIEKEPKKWPKHKPYPVDKQ
ncbi:MAG: PDZ domain-containing protein [Bacteroidales bacterium]